MFQQNEPFRFNFASDNTISEQEPDIEPQNDEGMPAEELLLSSQVQIFNVFGHESGHCKTGDDLQPKIYSSQDSERLKQWRIVQEMGGSGDLTESPASDMLTEVVEIVPGVSLLKVLDRPIAAWGSMVLHDDVLTASFYTPALHACAGQVVQT